MLTRGLAQVSPDRQVSAGVRLSGCRDWRIDHGAYGPPSCCGGQAGQVFGKRAGAGIEPLGQLAQIAFPLLLGQLCQTAVR